LALGLGVWEGMFEGVDHHWLRWCDAEGNWCLTDTEQERSAKEAAEAAQARAEAAQEAAEAELTEERRSRKILVERLKAMGIDPETFI
jgi:uncharacterized damage-inducible protein DinB